jgi:hypothetical protein
MEKNIATLEQFIKLAPELNFENEARSMIIEFQKMDIWEQAKSQITVDISNANIDTAPSMPTEILAGFIAHTNELAEQGKAPRLLTKEQYIKEARKVHGMKYDYSLLPDYIWV